MTTTVSVNTLAKPLVEYLIDHAAALRIGVERLENGCTLIDAGIRVDGGLEAGRIVAEICLGGLGTVRLTHSAFVPRWPLSVNVHTTDPVTACLGIQYAGWSLSHGQGKGSFYALGSGPARSLARKEKLYEELGYQDQSDYGVLVMEVDQVPPLPLIDEIAEACALKPADLTIILTPTSSLAGGMQVVARVLEVALHKAHTLQFPLHAIVDGSGCAPVPPPHAEFIQAMGRTNDAILFAGQVHLFVNSSDDDAEALAKQMPSSVSRDYGRPFAEVFKEYKYDFFKIDPMLFSPARVIVTAVNSGRCFQAGKLDEALLYQSFSL